MDTSQLMDIWETYEVNESVVHSVEKNYHVVLPENVKKMLSLTTHPFFWQGKQFCRLLSLSEILHASQDLHVDFIGMGSIPFFDKGENDFIIYRVSQNSWEMFNIVDQVSWHSSSDLRSLLPD